MAEIVVDQVVLAELTNFLHTKGEFFFHYDNVIYSNLHIYKIVWNLPSETLNPHILNLFPHLVSFTITNNTLSDLNFIGQLSDRIKSILQHLNVSRNKITDINAIKYCKSLQVLDISENQITDIKSISFLRKLFLLRAHQNNINEISSLSSCVELLILSLSYNQIKHITAIRNCPKLRTVTITNNPISSIDVKKVFNNLNSIHTFTTDPPNPQNNNNNDNINHYQPPPKYTKNSLNSETIAQIKKSLKPRSQDSLGYLNYRFF